MMTFTKEVGDLTAKALSCSAAVRWRLEMLHKSTTWKWERHIRPTRGLLQVHDTGLLAP
jgi:hypothetical protein